MQARACPAWAVPYSSLAGPAWPVGRSSAQQMRASRTELRTVPVHYCIVLVRFTRQPAYCAAVVYCFLKTETRNVPYRTYHSCRPFPRAKARRSSVQVDGDAQTTPSPDQHHRHHAPFSVALPNLVTILPADQRTISNQVPTRHQAQWRTTTSAVVFVAVLVYTRPTPLRHLLRGSLLLRAAKSMSED